MTKAVDTAFEFYSRHSLFTDPGEYAGLFNKLPEAVPELVRIVQGLVINPNDDDLYGVNFSTKQREEAHMRTVSHMLYNIQKFDASPLTSAREPSQRVSGSIRHFSVLLISMLRSKGIPARMRVGFATYLDKKKNEDRWIVEYWNSGKSKWVLVDPSIDDVQREHYNIDFDMSDLKYHEHFYLAGHAWKLCREGNAKPLDFGYKKWGGNRYIRGNLLRDVDSLNSIELLPWDFFGDLIQKEDNKLTREEKAWLESLADLTSDADSSLDKIREIYEEMPYSRLVRSKLRLLGLTGDMEAVDANNLVTSDINRLDEFRAKPAESDSGIKNRIKSELLELADSQGAYVKSQPVDLNNIVIRGARQNNLKNVNLTIPRSKFTVVTGVSGSGKSSIAFDTLYAEGQRRFVGSFSGSSQQQFEKPDFDQILGLNPTIAIEQKNNSSNPRSTVGTLTDIYDYLRVLFVRVGTFHCPQCGKAVEPYNSQQVVSRLSSLKKGTEFRIFAPVAKGAKGEQSKLFGDFVKQGYSHARIDMKVYDLRDEIPSLDKAELHSIEVEIDRMAVPENVQGGNSQFLDRLVNAVKKAYKAGKGTLIVSLEGEKDITLSEKNVCPDCDITYSELKTSYFSYNHPEGMCPECDGLGVKLNIDANLIVNKPHLSLMDGACQIYGDMRKAKKGGNWVTGQVFALAEKLGVDMEQPWQELPKEFRDAVLYGTGEECIHFTHEMNKGGRSSDINRPMEGLVNMVNRLYRQTKQDKNREAYAQYMSEQPCQLCKGERLCPEARYVEIGNVRYPEVASMSIARLNGWISNLPNILKSDKLQVARELLKEIQVRLQFMIRVGLHYLSLERPAPTLSGGEAQRIRLATQLGCGLVGILYVLDEPSIGLHPRDHKPLLETMKNLKDSGNTVVVVEHDADTMYEADYMIELGPGAGVLGGQLVATGTPQELMQNPLSLTGRYLKGELKISSPKGAKKRQPKGWLNLIGAQMNNLKDVTARFPIGMLTCVTGVSGSGKSSLVAQTLAPALSRILNNSQDIPGSYKQIEGIALLDKLIRVNQTPIGRTPRSNPATYIEVFDEVRKVFAATDEAKIRGISADWFSFNNKEGCCESCEGLGMKKVELHFLPDAWIKCQDCNGQRYNQQVLEVKYKGKTISDVLDMDAQQALELFEGNAKITRILRTLQDVGLDYIKLGQSAVSLSGGEAQRIKLAKELCRPDTGKTIYILDEPTTGLHFADIQKLLNVLHRLTDQGNTIIIIEHNLDVVKTADWVIDVGPNGGDEGGRIVAQGTPEEVSEVEESYTGKFLKQLYSRN